MKNKISILSFFILIALILSCQNNQTQVETNPDEFHQTMQQLTDVIVHDIFSPPVASRIYVYPSIAAYECVAAGNPTYESLADQLNDLENIPKLKDSTTNYQLAALYAFNEVSEKLVFSTDSIKNYQTELVQKWTSKLNKKEVKKAKHFGNRIAQHIIEWMNDDMYHETRSYPKFAVDYDDSTRWQPTPPDYMEGIEPHWNKIRTLVIDSAEQFKPLPPPPFSLQKDAPFYEELKEVYTVRQQMKTDNDERVEIAKFWDCNPYVSTHKGHFMFATKKITPGGHWIGITKIACKKNDSDFDHTVWAYTKTSIALFDAFISCWDEKYRSSLIRPETLINKYIDENWTPILQTPPFPEYTSGHSVISAAAAEALTSIFGNDFSFDDTTEVPYGLPVRSFNSFYEAKNEAAISRLYGGIHYRAAIKEGVLQGEQVGKYVVKNLPVVEKSATLASTSTSQ